MRAVFVANDVTELVPSMTTARLAIAAANMGIETWIAELGGLSVDVDDFATARARRAPRALDELGALSSSPMTALRLEPSDVVFVRLNPARLAVPAQVEFCLWVLGLLTRRGVQVINSAASLERTANKAFLSELPLSIRPRQAVAANMEDALAAIDDLGPEVVLKPGRGTRGNGVACIDVGSTSPRPLLELLLERGAVVIQERLHDPDGADKRIVLVDGSPLVVEGEPVAIRRVPAPGEFRSNLHAGGRSERTVISEAESQLIAELRPHLGAAGLRLAGIDILDGKLLEINVWAPGGIGPFAQLTGLDAATTLVGALLSAG